MSLEDKVCECGDGFVTTIGSNVCQKCRKEGKLDTPHSRRNLRERNAPGKYTLQEWFERIEFQNSLCFWCFTNLLEEDGTFHGTKDHLIPISRGGSHYIENIVAACWSCNRLKGRRTATEYRAYLEQKNARFSEVSSLPASKRGFSFPPKQLRIVARPEVSEAIFHISKASVMAPQPNPSERRNLLLDQIRTIRWRQLNDAGQIPLNFTEAAPLVLLGIDPKRPVSVKTRATKERKA